MQMYRVRFARQLTDDMVDSGDCIVCAASVEQAIDGVSRILELPGGATFEVTRVKPSLYLIGRKETKRSMMAVEAQTVDADLASSATFPSGGPPDEYWFEVTASAYIRAEHENGAIDKLAKSISREMVGERQRSSTRELDIKCDRSDFHPRSPAVQQNALYTHLRFFKGGDTRGKG